MVESTGMRIAETKEQLDAITAESHSAGKKTYGFFTKKDHAPSNAILADLNALADEVKD